MADHMRLRDTVTSFAASLLLLPIAASAQGTRAAPNRAAVMHVADSLAESVVKRGAVAGISIAVLRGSDTLVMKGYGSADIENDVPATAQTVYRIGSVTKQFTSVAIMQLVQQGKLSLDDDITKYVPNAPTHGRRILVRHLMNHTSGIPSYTDVGAAFARNARFDLSHDSLLAIVRDELWLPNGLSSTVYCSVAPIIKRRANGYDRSREGLVNTDYIGMDLPFAAGSLCSTVGDLAAWTRLLHSGKLVDASSFLAMTTPVKLTSGRRMSYGFGLSVDTLGAHRAIHHGGGINGFISELAYYPNDSLTVVVLANTSPAPSDQIAENIARFVFGMPFLTAPPAPADLPLTADEVKALAGNYRVTFP